MRNVREAKADTVKAEMISAEEGTGIMNLFNRTESKKEFHPTGT
jgi:hypothetical protein